jgi:hypothetical protein
LPTLTLEEVFNLDNPKVLRVQQLGGLALNVYITFDPNHLRVVVRHDCLMIVIARQFDLHLALDVTKG